ncbi:MAG: hypothetical protein EPO21_23645 [Chloroflexota bacterium]|nr:MAG: hypothetical protein EPO21_23645 [Chloroflexota bacterium]
MQPEEIANQIVAAQRGGADLREIMEQLAGLPMEDLERAVTAVARQEGDDVVELLSYLAHSGDQRLATCAVEALAGHPTPTAASVLQRIGVMAPDKSVRKQARRGLHRLRTAGIVPDEMPPGVAVPTAVRPTLRYYRGMLTNPDPHGYRAIIVGAERPSGIVDGVFALLSEENGLVQCSTLETSRRDFDQQVNRVRQQMSGLTWVEAPPSYCHFLIYQHAEQSRGTGSLSPEREHCAHTLGVPETLYQQPVVYQRLPADEVRGDSVLLDRGYELLNLPELGGWVSWLQQLEPVKKYAGMLLEARESRLVLSELIKRERETRILDAAIDELFTPARRPTLAGRLEELSFVFLESDRVVAARIALATALALREDSQDAIRANPFVGALTLASMEYAIKTGFGRAGKIITT